MNIVYNIVKLTEHADVDKNKNLFLAWNYMYLQTFTSQCLLNNKNETSQSTHTDSSCILFPLNKYATVKKLKLKMGKISQRKVLKVTVQKGIWTHLYLTGYIVCGQNLVSVKNTNNKNTYFIIYFTEQANKLETMHSHLLYRLVYNMS